MIHRLRLFARVAECGSFTAVADEFSIGQPAVSKAIRALERELGFALFHRNTRALALTEEGEAAHAAARRLLEAWESLRGSAASASPRGIVKVAAPMALGTLRILPALKAFLDRNPGVTVDLRLDDAFVDLVAGGIDIAVRVGEVRDSRLVAKPLGALRRELVAGTGYIAARGEPRTPADLKQHACIVHGTLPAHRRWSFRQDGRKTTVAVAGNVVTDNILGVRAAVEADLGIALVGGALMHDLVESRRVRRVLTECETEPLPVTLLFPGNRYVPARVRLVIDHLAATIGPLLDDSQPAPSRTA